VYEDGGLFLPTLRQVIIDQGLAAGLCGAGDGGAENSKQLVLDGAKELRFQIVIGGVADEPHVFVLYAHRTLSMRDYVKKPECPLGRPGPP